MRRGSKVLLLTLTFSLVIYYVLFLLTIPSFFEVLTNDEDPEVFKIEALQSQIDLLLQDEEFFCDMFEMHYKGSRFHCWGEEGHYQYLKSVRTEILLSKPYEIEYYDMDGYTYFFIKVDERRVPLVYTIKNSQRYLGVE